MEERGYLDDWFVDYDGMHYRTVENYERLLVRFREERERFLGRRVKHYRLGEGAVVEVYPFPGLLGRWLVAWDCGERTVIRAESF